MTPETKRHLINVLRNSGEIETSIAKKSVAALAFGDRDLADRIETTHDHWTFRKDILAKLQEQRKPQPNSSSVMERIFGSADFAIEGEDRAIQNEMDCRREWLLVQAEIAALADRIEGEMS